MRLRLFTGTLLLCAALHFPAVGQEGSAYIVGIGSLSCADWIGDPEAAVAGSSWVLGFFSGANTSRFVQVGANSDGPSIVAEARTECAATPDATLWDVVSDLYLTFAKREGRV